MFDTASSFNEQFNDWNVGKVTHVGYMFSEAIAFNQLSQPTCSFSRKDNRNPAHCFHSSAAKAIEYYWIVPINDGYRNIIWISEFKNISLR